MNDVFNSNELIELFGKNYIEMLKNSFIKMIFYWDKIELLLKKRGLLSSTNCHKIFLKRKLDDMLYEDYRETKLMDKILISINDMNITILNGWEAINKKYG